MQSRRIALLLMPGMLACLPKARNVCPDTPPRDRLCALEGQTCRYGDSPCGYDEECRCRYGTWKCVSSSCLADVPEVLVPDLAPEDLVIQDPTEPDASPVDPGAWDVRTEGGDLPSAACPEEPFSPGSCSGDARCEYGQECCCGQCYPSLVCQCVDGAWGCYSTDACLIPGCPDLIEEVPGTDLGEAPDSGVEDPPPPQGRCRQTQDCQAEWAFCLAPGTPPSCGICLRPENPCSGDEDCLALPETPICAPSRRACLCEPGATECQPRCDAPSMPLLCDPATERCDPSTGRCEPRRCRDAEDCPVNHRCPDGEDFPVCQHLPCTRDRDCDTGPCVLGRCHSDFGVCDFLKP